MKYIGTTISFSRSKTKETKRLFDLSEGKSFACFLKHRLSAEVSLLPDVCVNFMNSTFNNVPILPHSSYAINLATNDKTRHEDSIRILANEIEISAQINSNVVFHPGTCENVDDGIRNIISAINRVHEMTEYKEIKNPITSKLTHTGLTMIETMGGKTGSKIMGKTFDELNKIISGIIDKRRIGICLDTCHIFVAGYDIRTQEKWINVMNEFDNKVGFKYLKGVHLNDSTHDLGSGRDIHMEIGKGKIGLEPFKCMMKDKRFDDIPLVTETHLDIEEAKKEIKLLESFQ
jgi:apurinic endonuclease APN1